jgi:hypothetical protein
VAIISNNKNCEGGGAVDAVARMSRRKQTKPLRLNEDEPQAAGEFLMWILLFPPPLAVNFNIVKYDILVLFWR